MQNRHRWTAATGGALLLVLLASGCRSGGGSEMAAASPQPMAAAVSAEPALPPGVTAEMVTEGERLYTTGSCQRCHGATAEGAANGPSLKSGPWLHIRGQYGEIVQLITTGVSREMKKDADRRFPMNPRGGPMNLTDEQVRAVAAYVWTISRKKTI